MILHGPLIKDSLRQLCGRCVTRVFVASAYVQSKAFKEFLGDIDSHVEKKVLIVRWRAEDLVTGVSDLALYPVARENGWSVLMNPSLHAKIFLFDETAIIGSANLTRRGLWGFPPDGNTELAVKIDSNAELERWINTLEGESYQINDALYQALQDEVQALRENLSGRFPIRLEYGDHVQEFLIQNESPKLFTHDLLWTSDPASFLESIQGATRSRDVEHDSMLLRQGWKSTMLDLREPFVRSRAFRWLRSAVKDESYFGTLTADLHNALEDDPSPLRKTVKDLLNNLLCWTQRLAPDYFAIDKPNVSTRIRKRRMPRD